MVFNTKVQSATFNIYNKDSGNSYTVIKWQDYWHCDCKSYLFCVEPKSCKHIDEVRDVMFDLIPYVEEDDDE
jgi:hypothetical protein